MQHTGPSKSDALLFFPRNLQLEEGKETRIPCSVTARLTTKAPRRRREARLVLHRRLAGPPPQRFGPVLRDIYLLQHFHDLIPLSYPSTPSITIALNYT